MNFRKIMQKNAHNFSKGLMSSPQYYEIGYALELLAPCNFLVFGLGQDAHAWAELNKGGRTVFLEDDIEWIDKFSETELEIYPIKYTTKVEDHEKINFSDTDKLFLEMPNSIEGENWDLILVDAPLGHQPPRPYKGPGRMQSIYNAHRLLKDNGICIVDDMGRFVENTYTKHFFGEEGLIKVVENKIAIVKKAEIK